MENARSRLLTQPLAGTWTVSAGLTLVIGSLVASRAEIHVLAGSGSSVLAAALIASVALSYQFPIHLRHGTKLELGTVPLFLTAALLQPPLAALAAAVGTAAGELPVRRRRDLFYSDIASQAGRRLMIVLLASGVMHLPAPHVAGNVVLLASGVVTLFAGEIVTAPLLFTPVTGERPWRIIVTCLREAGPAEAGQYVLGFIGALLAAATPWSLTFLVVPAAALYAASKRAKELHATARTFLVEMADDVDARDPFTREHSKRVTRLVGAILTDMNIVGPEAQVVTTAARLHDIGKIGVPTSVLAKTGDLTPEERTLLQEHARMGADMLRSYRVSAFARGAEIVNNHHERWDGAGYPEGLKGTDIPFGSRVIAVADSFDAMTNDRPYRRAMTMERAAALFRIGSGSQWDPDVVSSLFRVIPTFSALAQNSFEGGLADLDLPGPALLAPSPQQ
jgi:putative nucleotidyltransferase with HDIG domain